MMQQALAPKIYCLPRQLTTAEDLERVRTLHAPLIHDLCATYNLPHRHVVWQVRLVSLVAQAEKLCAGVGGVRDVRLLDLGCGSLGGTLERDHCGTDPESRRHYEPWFPRVLHALGARVVGIDIGSLEGERFEHYQRDLSLSGAIDFLPSRSFDVVTLTNLLTSPHLCAMRTPAERLRMREQLRLEVRRVVRPQGILYVRDFVTIDEKKGPVPLDAAALLET